MKSRLDKWLWSVRIFKTRTKASDACRSGKVKINDKVAKASHDLRIGDLLSIRKRGINFSFKANKIIRKRVSASLAIPCYEDFTSPEELNKYNDWFIGKSQSERRIQGTGRPTKRERRVIDEFKREYFFEEE